MLLRLEDCSLNRARRGSCFHCNFFRFGFGSLFGAFQAFVKKGIEKGSEEDSQLEE